MARRNDRCCLCDNRLASRQAGQLLDDRLNDIGDTSWLDQVKIIAVNKRASALDKAFIVSGILKWESASRSRWTLQFGEHPNCPSNEDLKAMLESISPIPLRSIELYRPDCLGYAFPAHVTCLDFLARNIGYDSHTDLHAQDLHRTFCTLISHSRGGLYRFDPLLVDYDNYPQDTCQCCSKLIYHDLRVLNPEVTIHESLESFCSDSIKELRSEDSAALITFPSPNIVATAYGARNDFFQQLPPETVLRIMSFLPLSSLLNLRAASRYALGITNASSPHLWRQRIALDISWLPESFCSDALRRLAQKHEYKKLYKALKKFEKMAFCSHTDLLSAMALHNRMRIWRASDPVADLYVQMEHVRKQKESQGEESLASEVDIAACRIVAWGCHYRAYERHKRAWATTQRPLLMRIQPLKSWQFEELGALHIWLSWDRDGWLEDINAEMVPAGTKCQMSPLGRPGQRIEHAYIGADGHDWLVAVKLRSKKSIYQNIDEREGFFQAVVGLDLISAKGQIQLGSGEQGDEQIMHVDHGKIFIGFQGLRTAKPYLEGPFPQREDHDDGSYIVSRLGLLQTEPQHSALNEIATVDFRPDLRGKHLFEGGLPSSRLTFLPTGEQCSLRIFHSCPREMITRQNLVFGETEEELCSVTALVFDTNMTGIEVRFDDKPARQIGSHKHTAKVFPINGRAGERIVRFEMGIEDNRPARGVRVATNFGRTFSAGAQWPAAAQDRGPQGGTSLDEAHGVRDRHSLVENQANQHQVIGGISCTWALRKPNCCVFTSMALMVFSGENLAEDSGRAATVEWKRDTTASDRFHGNGLFWETSTPPDAWQTVPLTVLPGEYSAKYRDCGVSNEEHPRPICAWLDFTKPIESIRCRHVVFNAKDFSALKAEGIILGYEVLYTDGSKVCVGSSEFYGDVIQGCDNISDLRFCIPEFRNEVWEVGGKMIIGVQIWPGLDFTGISFSAEGDGHTQAFGLCKGDPRYSISFGPDQAPDGHDMVGLKFIIGDVHKFYYHCKWTKTVRYTFGMSAPSSSGRSGE